jgi:hypothetical protein
MASSNELSPFTGFLTAEQAKFMSRYPGEQVTAGHGTVLITSGGGMACIEGTKIYSASQTGDM